MNANFIELTTTDDLNRLFETSVRGPVILFKHSETCPISHGVYREIAGVGADVNLVVVQTSRPISDAIAKLTGIRHETPQAIIIKNGKPIYSASHYDVTAADVEHHLTD